MELFGLWAVMPFWAVELYEIVVGGTWAIVHYELLSSKN